MLANIRVAIPYTNGPSESEAVGGREALTRAICSLSRAERPQLYLVVTDEKLTALSSPLSYSSLFDGVIHVGVKEKTAEYLFGLSVIHFTSYERMLAMIDFCLTVSPEVLPNRCAAVWMPNFSGPPYSTGYLPRRWQWPTDDGQKIADQAAVIIFTSRQTEQDFLQAYPLAAGKTKVIATPFGYKEEWYKDDPVIVQQKYGLPDRFLLCPNHFWQPKNHPVLLKAVAMLRKQGQDVHLVCTGLTSDPQYPDYFRDIQRYVRLIGINDLVHILGPVPERDRIQLIRRCLFVIQPSPEEGACTLIHECRSLAAPLVMADRPIYLEQGYGIGFPATDAAALAEKIAALLPRSRPGPDQRQTEMAKQASRNLIKYFAREFCDIIRETIIKFKEPLI